MSYDVDYLADVPVIPKPAPAQFDPYGPRETERDFWSKYTPVEHCINFTVLAVIVFLIGVLGHAIGHEISKPSEAHQQGHDARNGGLDVSENPYPPGELRAQWQQGWATAIDNRGLSVMAEVEARAR